MDEVYLKYYVNQAGSGVGHFYSGPIYQRGYGVGSFLGGLFRSVLPILKKGSLALGRELISCGSNVMDDIDNKIPVKVAVTNRGVEALSKLKRKVLKNMSGNGYNGAKRVKLAQSQKRARTVRSNKNKKPKKTNSKKKNKKKPKTQRKKLTNNSKFISDIFDS